MSDLLDYCATTTSWTRGKCAEVRVGHHVTRYVRRGSGSPVIVLAANVGGNEVWGPVVEALAERYRLVIPQIPASEPDLGGWLRLFIEGIGAASVAIVAGGAAHASAITFTASDEFTVRRLVLVPDRGSDWTNDASIDSGRSTIDRDRTLHVARDWHSAEAVAHIERFLSETRDDD